MEDLVEFKFINLWGWWPSLCKTHTGFVLARVFGWCLYMGNNMQLVLEYVGLYLAVAEGSLKGAVVNLATTLVGNLCFIKVGILLTREKEILSLIAKLKDMDKEVRQVLPNDLLAELAEKKMKFSKFTAKLSKYQLFGTVHWVLRPVIYLAYDERVQVIEAWFPGDLNNLYIWGFVWFNQSLHVFSAMCTFIMFDSAFCKLLQTLLLQVEYLKVSLRRLDFTSPGVDAHPPLTLAFCVQYSRNLLLMHRRFNSLLRFFLFSQAISVTLAICFCIFELSSVAGTPLVKIINLLEMIGAIIYSTFIYCFLCQELSEENLEVMRAAYDNNWYEGNEVDKKALSTLIRGWERQFKFGFIIETDLNTFISVLKSSFTYFNFLSAISGEELVTT